MNEWCNFFDRIYVINLKKRPDRMKQATEQLNHYGIPFERWEAIEHEKGAEGLRLTMIQLFSHCVRNNYQNVLIFEDDLDIVEPDINYVMCEVVSNVPPGYDILYLGCHLCTIPQGFYSDNLLNGIRTAQATHAAAYSLKAIKKVLSNTNFFAPIDNCLIASIQKDGNCFVTYPLLVSQIVSHSDIYSDIPVMDWKKYIEGLYAKQMIAMKENGTFTTNAKQYNG